MVNVPSALTLLVILLSFQWHTLGSEYPLNSLTFTPTKKLFANPERGWISHRFSHDMWGIGDFRDSGEKVSLVLIKIDLSAYVQAAHIEQMKLDEIRGALQSCRKNGIKAILRSAYVWYEKLAPEPKNIETVKNHIMDMKPVYDEYEDVILSVEMGMFGPWGEIHSSYYSTINTHPYYPITKNALKQIHAAYMLSLPVQIYLQVRTPYYIRQIFDDDSPLSFDEVNQMVAKSRTGYHNDAYLNSIDDSGTFAYGWSRAQELRYISQMTRYTIFGGETFGKPNDEYNNANNALVESKLQHMTYLHRDYYKPIYDAWGTIVREEFTRKLGYRFELKNMLYSQQVAPGGVFYFRLILQNTGFAPIYRDRPIYLILDNGRLNKENVRYQTMLSVDIRSWTPEANAVTIERRIRIPVTIKEGTWNLLWSMPDKSIQLSNDSRFAVRFAHDNMWNNDGTNLLAEDILVTSSEFGLPSNEDKFEEISSPNCSTTDSNINQPQAVRSSPFIIFSAIFDKFYSFYQVLIDLDNDTRTGYSFQGLGADLLIENSHYYKHRGINQNSWNWQLLNTSIQTQINNFHFIWRIPDTEVYMSSINSSSKIIFLGTLNDTVQYSSTVSVN